MTTTPLALDSLDEAARGLLFTEARTANSFSDTPVTDDELRGVWELARWSPSMANSQPLRVLFVRTPEGRERLLGHMAEGNVAKTRSAPAVAVLAYDSEFHEHFPTVFPARGELMRGNFASMPGEAREGLAKYSAAIQTGVFMLAVRAHGLAAGPMAGFDGPGIDAEFFAGTTWRTHLVVNIGHPGVDPWFDRLPRLDEDVALAWA
ncbi:malonic semialdehyde reductase [Nocardioides sp.]|uniref:malonic semialdehyde reductase n=1 Tax=Nocardioides sp. TaxID=35761 RepID=UPI00272470D7|nr:malonic semialdehyde reductase [Nocardioides sp.]MDO9457584.1 malonic semialdehyde reductase [Nocardioides sp.]